MEVHGLVVRTSVYPRLSSRQAIRGGQFVEMLVRMSHHEWTIAEGQGFSPAAIAALILFLPRATRSLRSQAARGAEPGEPHGSVLTAGLKPRPSQNR